jgi:hypothetical protein
MQPKLEPKLVWALSETVVSLFYNVSMFRLNQNKQKTNLNSLIGSIFFNILQKILGFSVFFGFFICFGFFRFVSKQFGSVVSLYCNTETEIFNVSIELKQTETHPNSLKRVYLGIFQKI